MASTTAVASVSRPLTGTTTAFCPSRLTAGPSTAVAAVSAGVEPLADRAGIGIAEEPQCHVQLVRGNGTKTGDVRNDPGQPGHDRVRWPHSDEEAGHGLIRAAWWTMPRHPATAW